MSCLELLTADQMQAVDRRAVELGVNSYQLMQSAGRAVAVEIQNYLSEHSSEAPVSILMLVGPGNNGGDALVAATILKKAGIAVHVLLACGQPKQGSDAAQALAEWEGQVHLTDSGDGLLHEASLIVDALFGAGFSRALSGDLKTLVETVNALSKPVISVDVPSGLDGSTGGFDGACIKADVTITFFRYKIAHYLYPGRALCGQLVLAQIGLSEMHLNSSDAYCQRNLPEMFVSKLPVPAVTGHKFTRGHVLVRGGSMDSSGAARLSANTALYCGAGLVTLACDSEALPVNAAHLTAVMMQRCDTLRQWKRTLEDPRINVVLIGPGNGVNESTRRATLAALASNRHCVVDADSLSCWQSQQ
ncbi:MAG: NAD(P)H-hydrate epimerase, partial [Granulosicoccus sp.]|nr:NAD(P)H-hydrate epimerase [Granulosicoccus sp.]